jgi:broad specificity phosphatase PhoE
VFVLARHGHSVLNVERRVNGDPSVPVPLTEAGRNDARLLGLQLANVPLVTCVHTRFPRTQETAELAAGGRVPFEVEPLLDDIDVGELEGRTIEDYRAWKSLHTRVDPFPGGESLADAARRYAEAYRRLLARVWDGVVLVVCHEIPIRYALNAASDAEHLDAPVHDVANAVPFLFEPDVLRRAAERIDELAAVEPRK